MGTQSANERERLNAELRRKRRENPELYRAYEKKWRDTHPEKVRAKSLRRRGHSSAKHRAESLRYYKEHPEVHRAWVKAHPLHGRIKEARRRAQKKGGGGMHTVADWIVLCWASGWRCAYCGAGPLNEKTAVQEHRIPLVRGGPDEIGNIAVSCDLCNRQKYTLTDSEFVARRLSA